MAAPRRGAFALIITLIILSLLVVVAVSFLASMSSERQTAEAFTSKGRAGQAAQTGVDSAMAVLAESFRDFPDSATVWDVQQTVNSGTPGNTAVVSSPYNEGTSLYLRAMPTASGVANPMPEGAVAPGGTPVPANDPGGNDPGNLQCKTFVLPLISGVPGGQAQVVSNKANIFPAAMNLGEPDPTKQNWADLNVRRVSGDVQGYIGSPPGWTGAPTGGSGSGPKPARAYWVNAKDASTGLVTGRYAYWVDDESFRVNTSLAGPLPSPAPAPAPPTQPPDNTAQPTATPSGSPRSLQPSDLMLIGTLTKAADTNASSDAATIFNARAMYPGSFFPDPLAFSHSSSTPLSTAATDLVRYLTTNQSGTLNLTRHGTQRLNLNSTVSTVNFAQDMPPYAASAKQVQSQLDQLVLAMEFHLPYLGERFYRTSTNTDKITLNALQVPGSPKSSPNTTDTDQSEIYYYKVAANIRDYLDTDCQPTMVGNTGKVILGAPTAPLEAPNAPAQGNDFWAQGKEAAPFIQEVAVRYRPNVTTAGNATPSNPKGHYDLQVDYYVEFWNMTDRDIYAAPQPAPNSTQPNLSGATLWVRDQQTWTGYEAGTTLLEMDNTTTGEILQNSPYIPADWQIDLTNGVLSGTGGAQDGTGGKPLGVVFRAGTVTVITTDPNYSTYTYKEFPVPPSGVNPNPGPGDNRGIPGSADLVVNMANLYYCPNLLKGQRHYSGKVTDFTGNVTVDGGLMLGNEFANTLYSNTEISLANNYGYIDVARGAITKGYGPGANYETNTYKFVGMQGSYNDYGFGSSLMGNLGSNVSPYVTAATPSQLGDPRTNNEQLSIQINSAPTDVAPTNYGTHYVPSVRTFGAPNFITQQPASTTSGTAWSDYYIFPSGASHPSPDATSAPAVIADAPLTSLGELGDLFDPARLPGTGGINIAYSRGGGRTFKIGQHDDLYSNDPSGNAANSSADNISASNGWAAWRLTDVFDVADPIELPGRININGVQRDNGAALLAFFQGFTFQPKTVTATNANNVVYTPATGDPVIHGDAHTNSTADLAGQTLDTTGTSYGFSQVVSQMAVRLNNTTAANGPYGPFFERGELAEIGTYSQASGSVSWLFGVNPTSPNNSLVSSVDLNKTFDHSREEFFRRIAEMICTRGDTFTVYAVGQSIVQTVANGPLKVTGTQRLRVTFRLVPKVIDSHTTGGYDDFHPGYTANTDGSVQIVNSFDATTINTRFAKPDRYDIQVLQATTY